MGLIREAAKVAWTHVTQKCALPAGSQDTRAGRALFCPVSQLTFKSPKDTERRAILAQTDLPNPVTM